jgi:hypothetical protein
MGRDFAPAEENVERKGDVLRKGVMVIVAPSESKSTACEK